MKAAITTRPIVQAAVRSAYMRRTLMVLTLPPGTRHANVDILLSAPGASERTRSSRKARDIQALRREDEQFLSRAGSVRLFADGVGDDMAERPQPQPDGRDPLWRETLWSLGLLMAAAFLVFLIAETAPR